MKLKNKINNQKTYKDYFRKVFKHGKRMYSIITKIKKT